MNISVKKLIKVYKKSITGDGIGNIIFYRPLSILCTAFFVFIKYPPNYITFLSLLANISAALYFFQGNFFLGMLFFHMGNIFDCTDGQVALYTNSSTDFGKYFDAWVDRISYILIFSAIIFQEYILHDNIYLLYLYLLWIVIFYSYEYLEKLSVSPNKLKGLQIIQKTSYSFFGKFSRYIRWDGTITAIFFHVFLYFSSLSFVIVPFLLWYLLLLIVGIKDYVKK